MIDEKLLYKLETMKQESMATLKNVFMRKAQLDEEKEENDMELQKLRGELELLDKISLLISRLNENEKIEKAKQDMLQRRQEKSSISPAPTTSSEVK